MRLARFLGFLVVFGFSAIAAYAQTPVDPVVRINQTSSPSCDNLLILCLTPDPGFTKMTLSVPYANPLAFDFSYDDISHDIPAGTQLTEFILEYTLVPALTGFQCESNIWANCVQSNDGSGDYFFDFSGGGACVFNGNPLTCPGNLTDVNPSDPPGGHGTNTPLVSEIPEPGTVVLFATGLILLFVGTRRRIHART